MPAFRVTCHSADRSHSTWSAATIFQVKDRKLYEFIKDWNKLSM